MSELRAQLREWREAVDKRLPPWWSRALAGLLLVIGIVLPFLFSSSSAFMNATIIALAYAVMSLGLNIVVGFAGLLDLGYVAFYALGAYSLGWFGSGFFFKAQIHALVSPVASTLPGVHLNFILILIGAALICAAAGMVIGLPTLRLRGDYIAIVTLAFGEIIADAGGQRPERPRRRRHDADRRQPRHQRGGLAVLPRDRVVQPAEPAAVVLADLRHLARRPVRQPAAARLPARPGLDRAARGRGRGRVDGHSAGEDEAARVRDRRRVRRHGGCVLRHVLHRGQRRAVPVRVLDLHPRHGDHRRARVDLGRGRREAWRWATSTTT